MPRNPYPTEGEIDPETGDVFRSKPSPGWVSGTKPSKPSDGTKVAGAPKKVESKGTSGLEETSTKSLSQILKERDEKRKKAELIKSGGK